MRLLSILTVAATLTFAATGMADAKTYRHSSGSHATKFRTSTCKTSSCHAKHPSGTWVHPITPRKRH